MSLKFISAKKPTDYANRLAAVQQEISAMAEKLKALKAEEESLEEFLYAKSTGEDFQFKGADGYLMQMQFTERSRTIMDQAKVREMLAKMGKKVPTKPSEWVESSISYVSE